MSIDDLIGMEDKVFDSETLEIDFGYVRNILAKHFKVVVACTALCLIIGIVFGLTVFSGRYKSEATVILNPIDIPNILTNYRSGNTFFQGYTARSNPYKNQEELLRSRRLAEKVFKQIKEDLADGKIKINRKDAVNHHSKIARMLDAKHVRGTDFIKITVIAPDRLDAKVIAEEFVKVYVNESLEITREPLDKQKNTLAQQMKKKTHELEELNDNIKNFQEKNKIVDLNTRGRVLVEKLEGLNTKIKDNEALANAYSGEATALEGQLNLKAKEGLKSVARGQNSVLIKLQDELSSAQQDYEVKSLTYSPTNPMMVKLDKKIQVLIENVKSQQIQTVGAVSSDDNSVIKDRVRSDLVLRLATREAEAAASLKRIAVFKKQDEELKKELSQLPSTQVRYAELLLKRKDLEDILSRIKAKLTEVQIQLTGLSAVIQPHDPPSDPVNPIFPQPWHIVLFIGSIGFILSALAVVAYETFKNQTVSPRFVERGLQIPVLALIPWSTAGRWKSMKMSNSLEVLASPGHAPTLKAYHTLALNLKHQANLHEHKCLAVSSIYQANEQANMLANMALCMAQSGHRVVIVDTNLGRPNVNEVFGHSLNYEKGLTELINDISESLIRNPEATTHELAPFVQKSLLETNVHPDLHYINAGVALDNTFEFLNSAGFKGLIHVLREHYDWVFFDTPPLLAGADSYVIQNFSDALVMLVERDATDDQILLANKKVMQINTPIVGAVLREHSQS